MSMIKSCVESFIHGYDKVMELIGENGGKKVVRVTNDEIRAYASELRKKYQYSNKGHFERKDQSGDREHAEKKEPEAQSAQSGQNVPESAAKQN